MDEVCAIPGADIRISPQWRAKIGGEILTVGGEQWCWYPDDGDSLYLVDEDELYAGYGEWYVLVRGSGEWHVLLCTRDQHRVTRIEVVPHHRVPRMLYVRIVRELGRMHSASCKGGDQDGKGRAQGGR